MDTIVAIKDFLWDYVLVYLLIFSGIFITIRLGFPQITKLAESFRALKRARTETKKKGLVTPLQAFYTSLAAQIGTGNVAGVGAAIVLGGPGAVFWMWISGLLGMAVIYAESVLAISFREEKDGEVFGGPAYYLKNGIKNKALGKFLASLFAILVLIALPFAGNMVQSNSIANSVQSSLNISPVYTGAFIAVLLSFIIIGGAKRIGKVAERVVPFMIFLFLLHGFAIIIKNYQMLGGVISSIFSNAFSSQAVVGGVVGVTIKQSIKNGLARGLFSNEAGMGSTPHANALADVDHPAEQGMISMLTVVVDTFVVCTMSALIILITNAHMVETSNYTTVLQNGFDIALGGSGNVFFTITLFFFAFTTILGWYYYGESNVMYLFGKDAINYYKIFAIIAVVAGTIISVDTIYTISDLFNGFMVIPNTIGILLLSKFVLDKKKEYDRLNVSK